MGFQARHRIRHDADFDTVRKAGRRRECGLFLFTLLERENSGPSPVRRLGVVVPRRVGLAVDRNLAKRRFRVLFQRYRHLLPPVCDLVVLVRPAAASVPFRDLEKRFLTACRRSARTNGSSSNHGIHAKQP